MPAVRAWKRKPEEMRGARGLGCLAGHPCAGLEAGVRERERDGGAERHIVFAYVDGDRSEWLRREQLEVPRPALALQSFPPG